MKGQGLFGIGISLLFIFIGYYLYFVQAPAQESNKVLFQIVGLVTMIFFGFLAVLGIKKAISRKD